MNTGMNLNWRWIATLASIMVLGTLLSACDLNGEASQPTLTPTPSSTPGSNLGSISGLVWEDMCENFSQEDMLPAGCVDFGGDPDFVGNGVLEAGEVGIGSAYVSLGQGVCPSEGLATTMTDENGKFTFDGLEAGVYCVTATDPISKRGLWTYPKDDEGEGVGHMTISLRSGDRVKNVNFGRDHVVALPTPEPTIAPTMPPCVDKATFIRDVTIPDGIRLDPGESFVKTWRLRNSGTCTWTPKYAIVFVSGASMQAAKLLSLPGQVPPGSEVDLNVAMQAPMTDGDYVGFWKLRNANGNLFGIGEGGKSPFWSRIIVGPEPEPEITEWRGEYYDNTKLEGETVLVRNDKKIDFNWNNGSPSQDVPSDGFSARWTRTLTFEKALYRFHIEMDDGAALWIDDRLVVDEWKRGAVREVTLDLDLKKGAHDIKVEYYEVGGNARVRFWWEKISSLSFEGWKGMYWFNRSLNSKWALVRDDEAIDFHWEFDSPQLGIPEDDFSVRWEKEVDFDPGVYIFYAIADDGFRFYLDDALVIDEWHLSNGSEVYSAELELDGIHDLTIHYYERKQHAKVQFWWERKNESPVAVDDEYRVDAGTDLQVEKPGVLENDTDEDGDKLSALLVTDVSDGTLTLNEDGSFIYTPSEGFIGTDSFEYRASDGLAESEVTSVSILVESLNHVPEAVDDEYRVDAGTELQVEKPGVLENDTDEDGDELSTLLVTDVSNGTLTLNGDGSFNYTPSEGFIGTDSFEYRASDGLAESEVTSVSILVEPLNHVPEAVDDTVITKEEEPVIIDVMENDLGLGDTPIELTINNDPENGSVEILESQIIYSPYEEFIGEDSFSYTVTDADGESSTAVVTVTVAPKGIEP